jgi:hypothetical protein
MLFAQRAAAALGESLASHRDGRGASLARRDDREYREYLREEQRSQRGCIARRMQPDFYHGLLIACAALLFDRNACVRASGLLRPMGIPLSRGRT